jgi:hypothetical protein
MLLVVGVYLDDDDGAFLRWLNSNHDVHLQGASRCC